MKLDPVHHALTCLIEGVRLKNSAKQWRIHRLSRVRTCVLPAVFVCFLCKHSTVCSNLSDSLRSMEGGTPQQRCRSRLVTLTWR
jgi:hypothetical protein